MNFGFDIEKAIAAAAFLLEREGGELDMFLALKMLYLADKQALIRWGKPITGDSFVALPKGPVLQEVYDLFKGTDAVKAHQARWNECFTELVSHKIRLRQKVDIGLLSEREMDILEEARQKINEMAPWEVARWLHETCPEWRDPKGHSLPIQPEAILKTAGMSPKRIREIGEENEAFRRTKELLSRGR
jgi:uncharacterized phage-associated protein